MIVVSRPDRTALPWRGHCVGDEPGTAGLASGCKKSRPRGERAAERQRLRGVAGFVLLLRMRFIGLCPLLLPGALYPGRPVILGMHSQIHIWDIIPIFRADQGSPFHKPTSGIRKKGDFTGAYRSHEKHQTRQIPGMRRHNSQKKALLPPPALIRADSGQARIRACFERSGRIRDRHKPEPGSIWIQDRHRVRAGAGRRESSGQMDQTGGSVLDRHKFSAVLCLSRTDPKGGATGGIGTGTTSVPDHNVRVVRKSGSGTNKGGW